MPVEAKPLFRPDVLRSHLSGFSVPTVDAAKLERWADLIATGRIDNFGEEEILPDFLSDFFVGMLGYTRPAGHDRYTIGWERHIEVDGQFADAVLGDFNGQQQYTVVLEGKGPRDPLERPFAGRRRSAVEQGYHYAINLPCDWILVTSIRQTRLYHKGSDQSTFERFDTERLAGANGEVARSNVLSWQHDQGKWGNPKTIVGWVAEGPMVNVRSPVRRCRHRTVRTCDRRDV
jgi:hypothetical protein